MTHPPAPKSEGRKGLRWPWKKEADSAAVIGTASAIVSVVSPALELVSDIASNVGIPAAKFGVGCISQVLKRAEQVAATKSAVETLQARISDLSRTLQSLEGPMRDGTLPDPIRKRLDRFANTWSKIEADAETLVSSGILKRFADCDRNAEKLSRLVEQMSGSIQNLLIEGTISMEILVADIHSRMVQVTAKPEEPIPFQYARGARYDQNDTRDKCVAETRVDILRRIMDWISNALGAWVLWLNGVAGSGKTTIAYSIADWCDDSTLRLLAASFFCSRSDAECSDVNLIVSTIVHQLCSYSPAFKERVLVVVKNDPTVLQASVKRQVKELLARPFKDMGGALRDKVIIIDALDECKDKAAASTILDAILPYLSSGDWPRIIITSRPEQHIRTSLERIGPNVTPTTRLILHEIQIPTIKADITTYFNFNFPDLRNSYGLPEEWPGRDNIDTLARLSGGLFVVASTALKFISHPGSHQPDKRLQLLLNMRSSSKGIVDDLYQQIATDYCSEVEDDHAELLSTILGALVVLQRPLSVPALAALLGLDQVSVRSTLAGLHSVLLLPKDNEGPIQFFHPTFPEFLIKSSLSYHIPAAFHVETGPSHVFLLRRSLEILCVLKRDILDIREPGILLKEIPDLRQKISAMVPPQLDYACRYWSVHLCFLSPGMISSTAQSLHEFVSIRILYWLELCILLGTYHDAIAALDASERACRGSDDFTVETDLLLANCRRFALAYTDYIRGAPLQLYHWALPLVPRSSLLMRTYGHLLEHSVVVSEGAQVDWGPCLSSFDGHEGHWVYAVAFSPDGMSFATGGNDGAVKIWRTLTCAMLLSIDHDNDIAAVTYSPHGTHIALATWRGTVEIWDVLKGDHVQTLSAQLDDVRSLSYSADGHRLAVADQTKVCVWDISGFEGRCTLTLDINANGGTIALSPFFDSTGVAYFTDAGLCLRGLLSPISEVFQVPGSGDGLVAISPGGRHIAATREYGDALHIWTLSNKQLVRSVEIPSEIDLISCLAFSKDGTQIACGRSRGRVLLWQVPSSDPPRVLAKHNACVRGMSWSPDGLNLVSVAIDGTVCLWDTMARYRGRTSQLPIPTSPDVRSSAPRVALYSDCSSSDVIVFDLPLPSPFDSRDHTVRLPDSAPGTLTLHPDSFSAWHAASKFLLAGKFIPDPTPSCLGILLSGKRKIRPSSMKPISPVAISENGKLIAYAPPTDRGTVTVFDIYNRAVIATLASPRGSVSFMTFSPDSTLLVCGSYYGTISIWRLATQTHIAEHHTNGSYVKLPVFSPDGRLIAVLSESGVEIVEADTGRNVMNSQYRNAPLAEEVAFTPDGTHVVGRVNSSWSDPFFIWEVGSSTKPLTIPQRDALKFIATIAVDYAPRWNLETRRWPAYIVPPGEDTWVYAVGPKGTHRVGWLPRDLEVLPSFGEHLYVLDRGNSCVMSFDMSRMLDYLNSL